MARSAFMGVCAAAGVVATALLPGNMGIGAKAYGGAYSDAIMATPGLAGYWRLGETEGDYVDSSTQGNNGTANGSLMRGVTGPRPSDGFNGFEADNAAAGFDANDDPDWVQVNDPTSGVLDPRTGDFSFSLWFKGPNDGGDYMMIGKAAGTRDGYFFERLPSPLGNYSHKLNVSMSPNSATPGVGPLGPVSDPEHWTNAVAVLHRNRTEASPDYQASGVSLFINGQFFGSDLQGVFDGSPGPNMDNIQAFLIGAYRISTGAGAQFTYTGSIDEVSVFDRALSPTEIAGLYTAASVGTPSESTWAFNGSGSWTVAGNWQGGVPNAAGAVANFGTVITSSATVTLDAPITVGKINFSSPVSYTIAGANALRIDDSSGGQINVTAGSHTIDVPIVLAKDTTVTLSGGGSLAVRSVRGAGLSVNGGTMKVTAKAAANDPSGTTVVTSLTVGAGAALDLTNNSAVIDYTGAVGTLVGDLRQMISGGTLTSSSANAAKGLGYGDNAGLGKATFAGQTVDSSSVLIKYTYLGDTNLDGQVDVIDLGNLATAWQTNAPWTGGDSNYDGMVDVIDLGLLATNWQAGVGSPLGPESLGQALAAYGLPGVSVPEPATLALAAFSFVVVRRQRRRPA